MTRDAAIPVLNQVLAVPATRTLRGIPTEVQLDATDGMSHDCAVTLDSLTLVRVSLCTRRITRLSSERMQEVCEALRVAIAC